MKIYILLTLLLASCTFKKKDLTNQKATGHDELYSMPNDKVEKVPAGMKRIVIASTNDLEGHLNPHHIQFKDDFHKNDQTVSIGGVDIIASYFEILKKQFKNVILVDSGDIFSAESKNHQDVRNYYADMNYSAVTVGLRDFSLKLNDGTKSSSEMVMSFAKTSAVPVILSNMYELKTARGIEWKGTKPYQMVEIEGVKVGILGLVPNDLVTLTPVDNRVGLYVENMIQSTLKYARLMRSLGAQMIVVLTHQGLVCGKELAENLKLPLSKVNFEPTKENACDTTSPLGIYLNRLPPELVDVVIGGRNHLKVANFINGTLVMSGFEEGQSFNFAEFFFDTKTGKVVPDKTVVHQPVYFCREFFKESNDCYYEDSKIDHKERIPAKFLGEEIKSHEETKKKYLHYFQEPKYSSVEEIEVKTALEKFAADLTYLPNNSMHTQLITLEISGRELAKILEEDFHQSEKSDWKPSPFELKENTLSFVIQGEKLNLQENYKVLFDLETLQMRKGFLKYLGSEKVSSYPHISWMDQLSLQDTIETNLAAPQRQ